MRILAISLLAILAGILLLAKVRKEQLGKFFAFVSWFFIVVGFILFIGFLGGGIFRMTHWCKTGHPECRQEMMMKGCQPGMHHLCCPADKCRHDSTMKVCPKYLHGDTAKMPPPKTK